MQPVAIKVIVTAQLNCKHYMNDQKLIDEMTVRNDVCTLQNYNYEILHTMPKIVYMYDVFSSTECDIALKRTNNYHFVKAKAFNFEEDKSTVMDNRSNSLAHDFDARLSFIPERISQLFLHPMQNIEPVQVLRYDVGEEYKPHCDYFNYKKGPHIVDNDRVCTALTYLNDDFEGGGTWFPQLDITVQPKRGAVLYWEYYKSDPLSLHAGLPVESGVKYAATSWIRGEQIKPEDMERTK